MIKVRAVGPTPAPILIVGEAPGEYEERLGEPFVGVSGEELTRMLHEAGIMRSDCRVTNVCPVRPLNNDISWFFQDKKGFVPGPEIVEGLRDLELEVFKCKPNVIIALGDTALWACTNLRGITSWRGSVLESKWGFKVIPTYHPAAVLRMWEWRAIVVLDLRRALRESAYPEVRVPPWRFSVRPTFSEAMDTLNFLLGRAKLGPLPLAIDIETRQRQIACIGFAWSSLDAMCIPILCTERANGYWNPQEEEALAWKMRELFTHPNLSGTGQNFSYDAQYFAKEYGYVPRLGFDTMVAQHVAFAGMSKGLDFLSSMYCEFHQYWKDEGKLWDPKIPEDRLWIYNCRDAVATFEVRETLAETLDAYGLMHIFAFRMELWTAMLHVMLRGVRMDLGRRKGMAMDLIEAQINRENWLRDVLGFPVNIKSPKQMQALFYDVLKLPVIKHRKTKRPTTDDDALTKIETRDVMLKPLTQCIRDLRSIGVFLSTFVQAELDTDQRMRCSFNIAGPETYRFSSSENAFGSGTNLQNIPKGDDEPSPGQFALPNVRELFIPDPGYTIYDVDLAGADAQVVAWEAEDEQLKEAFRAGLKVHAVNAKDLFGGDAGPDGKREPYYTRTKSGVHATNYGASARTVATTLGITVHEAERFQARWFSLHPGIRAWHRRVELALQTKREVRNAFGYRRYYFDRVEGLLPEALAWIPQSTVAHVSEMGLLNLHKYEPRVQVLLQVHDSIVFQAPTHLEAQILPRVRRLLVVPVPYDDPLIIQSGIKGSTKSWGHAQDMKWPEIGDGNGC